MRCDSPPARARADPDRPGSARPIRTGPARPGPLRPGPARLAHSGSARLGPARPSAARPWVVSLSLPPSPSQDYDCDAGCKGAGGRAARRAGRPRLVGRLPRFPPPAPPRPAGRLLPRLKTGPGSSDAPVHRRARGRVHLDAAPRHAGRGADSDGVRPAAARGLVLAAPARGTGGGRHANPDRTAGPLAHTQCTTRALPGRLARPSQPPLAASRLLSRESWAAASQAVSLDALLPPPPPWRVMRRGEARFQSAAASVGAPD